MSPLPSTPSPPGPSADTGCPTDAELSGYLEGSLSVEVSTAIDAHLDECPACYQVVAGLAARTSLSPRSADTGESAGLGDGPPASGASSPVEEIRRLRNARPLPAGTALGRFVVLEWIGEGASGVVYAAYDAQLDRKIALKLLRSKSADDPTRVDERALDEARAMGKAAHPNVVVIHDVGAVAGHVFIAMEFVQGTTLRDWLDAAPRSTREILRVFVDAGRGLAAAHDAGVVHRDFKPTNVLIGEDGRVRVTDFGIAISAADPGRATIEAGDALAPGRSRGSIVGTPAYMSPEQRRGELSDVRSDQYSFCVALLAALGDRSVPHRLRAALRRGTSARSADRFASMADLLSSLAPGPRGRRDLAVVVCAAVAIAAGSLALAYRERHERTANVCRGAEQQLVGVWDARRKADVERAFFSTGKPLGAPSARGTLGNGAAHSVVCSASAHVRRRRARVHDVPWAPAHGRRHRRSAFPLALFSSSSACRPTRQRKLAPATPARSTDTTATSNRTLRARYEARSRRACALDGLKLVHGL